MCGDQSLTRDDDIEIDILDRDRFVNEIAHMSKVEGAFVLASVQKDASRMATGRLSRQDTGKEHPEVRSRRGGDSVCMSSAQKRAYLESATDTPTHPHTHTLDSP